MPLLRAEDDPVDPAVGAVARREQRGERERGDDHDRGEELSIHSPDETSRLAAWLQRWSIPEPVAIGPTSGGINNLNWFVDTPTGGYVLRRYQNTADPARVRYEHAILRGLQAQPLPFGVPAPVPTRDGQTLLELSDGGLAALCPLLPGAPPDRSNPGHVRACGAALAHLHAALRSVDPGPAPDLPTFGDLEHIHHLVPDPWSISADPRLAPDNPERLSAILARVRAAVPQLYAELPSQLCHNDYGPGNTLQIEGRTSAVLDFEFAWSDLRAIDVATGWYWSIGSAWGSGREIEIAAWFLDGYRSVAPVSATVAAAMPLLALLHRTTALVHWVGRSRAGLDPQNLAAEQAERLLDLDTWLTKHGDELVVLAGG